MKLASQLLPQLFQLFCLLVREHKLSRINTVLHRIAFSDVFSLVSFRSRALLCLLTSRFGFAGAKPYSSDLGKCINSWSISFSTIC